MSTKLYLHAAANALSGTFPAAEQENLFNATKTWTNANNVLSMDTTKGVSQASKNSNTAAQTASQNDYIGIFVSPPLDVNQTVGGGAITFNIAGAEANANANFRVNRPHVYVWRPSTGAVVGHVLHANADGTTTTCVVPTAINSEQVDQNVWSSSSAVSGLTGDVVICEVWAVFSQAASTAYSCTVYFDGATEDTTENDVVSDHAAFLQLAETLTFTSSFTPKERRGDYTRVGSRSAY